MLEQKVLQVLLPHIETCFEFRVTNSKVGTDRTLLKWAPHSSHTGRSHTSAHGGFEPHKYIRSRWNDESFLCIGSFAVGRVQRFSQLSMQYFGLYITLVNSLTSSSTLRVDWWRSLTFTVFHQQWYGSCSFVWIGDINILPLRKSTTAYIFNNKRTS